MSLRVVTDPAEPGAALGASCAIGNFDGVHLGHQAVLDRARGGGPLAVMTFEPHPREHFGPPAEPFRLMSPQAKASRLAKLGVEVLYQLDFARIAPLSAEAFGARVLAPLGLSRAVVGEDFRFGKGRAGDGAMLEALGRAHGFETVLVPLRAAGGEEISSTRIREALSEGRPRDAARMLGHWHRIEGEVLHGEKRGRTLGFPTANLSIEGLHRPRFGVYAVTVDVLEGPHAGTHMGAASLGLRPQYGGEVPNLETFLLDFSGDLYGTRISVGLVEFIRPEATFPSEEAFVARMHADVEEARAALAETA